MGYVVFDRGYTDYTWYQELTEDEVFFVTRLKINAIVTPGRKRRSRKNPGVIKDQENSPGQTARNISAGHLSGRGNGHHLPVRDQCP
jgi:hypothetical protein